MIVILSTMHLMGMQICGQIKQVAQEVQPVTFFWKSLLTGAPYLHFCCKINYTLFTERFVF